MISLAELGPRALGDEEFALFQRLVKRVSGIALGPQKKPLLLCRLGPRLRALGAPGICILATDLSVRALDQAQRAVWPIERASEIPEERLRTRCVAPSVYRLPPPAGLAGSRTTSSPEHASCLRISE